MKTNYSWNWLLITHLQAAASIWNFAVKFAQQTAKLQMRSSPMSEANVLGKLVIGRQSEKVVGIET